MLKAYSKGEQDGLSEKEMRQIRKVVEEILDIVGV